MLNRVFVAALALAAATPVLAAETAAEKPKCECCAKMKANGAMKCCDGDKEAPKSGAEAGGDPHKDHAGH